MCKFLSEIFKKVEAQTGETINTISGETITPTPINEIEPVVTEENNGEEENNIMDEIKYNGIVILLDNGHAKSTPGKRSPKFEDGSQFFEYEFNREIVKRIASKLNEMGVNYEILVPEVKDDIKLTERANRANAFCSKYGNENCMLISVHVNAAGMGDKWMNGRGWSVWTTIGHTKSDEYATIFYEEAEKILPDFDMTLRKNMTDEDPDFEENFTILYKTNCPALLTENLFMDNKTDCEFLRTEVGKEIITQIHINAIRRICFK